jgi:hypothetical protein
LHTYLHGCETEKETDREELNYEWLVVKGFPFIDGCVFPLWTKTPGKPEEEGPFQQPNRNFDQKLRKIIKIKKQGGIKNGLRLWVLDIID